MKNEPISLIVDVLFESFESIESRYFRVVLGIFITEICNNIYHVLNVYYWALRRWTTGSHSEVEQSQSGIRRLYR